MTRDEFLAMSIDQRLEWLLKQPTATVEQRRRLDLLESLWEYRDDPAQFRVVHEIADGERAHAARLSQPRPDYAHRQSRQAMLTRDIVPVPPKAGREA